VGEQETRDGHPSEQGPIRLQWQWVSTAGLALVLGVAPIYWGSYNAFHHRDAKGLPELFAGLAAITIIFTARRLLGPEYENRTHDDLQSIQSLGLKQRWFRSIPSDEWQPPTWPEVSRLGILLSLVGAYPALSSVNQLFFTGYSSQHALSYVVSLFFFGIGVLIWCLLPLLIFRKLGAEWNDRKRHSER
jgi:hypothetical protein